MHNEIFDEQYSGELREVNESLLMAGLRHHELAEQSQEQLAFIRAVTDSLDEVVCALDCSGRVTFFNSAAGNLVNVSPADFVGQDFHRLAHVDCETYCPLLNAQLAETEVRSGEGNLETSNGRAYPVSYSVTPIAVNQQVVGMVVVLRDISERKWLEEAQEALLVHERAERANAESAVRIRSEILGTVSHDLRTPLTLVKGVAQHLKKNVADGRRFDTGLATNRLSHIETAATRMESILGELLDVAMLDAGDSLALRPGDVDLVGLLSDVVAQQQMLTNHRLVLDVPQGPLIGTWDRVRLERVVHNLLSNAIRFSPDDSSITIRLRRLADEDWVLMEILDWGVGIPAADLPHVFTRYYRASNSIASTSGGGVGLGLAGSKEIIEKHGGTITLESVEGVGTSVSVRLPISSNVS